MLVAVKNNKGGYLVAKDTRTVLEDRADDSSLESNDLIFPCYDDPYTIMGIQGDHRQAYFVKYLSDILPPNNKPLTMEWMVKHFVPNVFDGLVRQHFVAKDADPMFDITIIVARRNKAFLVERSGTVTEIGNEECTGIGSNYADGVLLLNKDKDPLVRVAEAFNIASKMSYHVSTNVVTSNSNNPEPYVIYDGNDIPNICNGTFVSSIEPTDSKESN